MKIVTYVVEATGPLAVDEEDVISSTEEICEDLGGVIADAVIDAIVLTTGLDRGLVEMNILVRRN